MLNKRVDRCPLATNDLSARLIRGNLLEHFIARAGSPFADQHPFNSGRESAYR